MEKETNHEESEEIFVASDGGDPDEEGIQQQLLEQGDEDAIFIADFEEQIVDAVQESDLAQCFTMYQDARARLKEKARSRGFWPVSSGKSNFRKGGGGKGGGKDKGKFGARKTLAEFLLSILWSARPLETRVSRQELLQGQGH